MGSTKEPTHVTDEISVACFKAQNNLGWVTTEI